MKIVLTVLGILFGLSGWAKSDSKAMYYEVTPGYFKPIY